MLQTVWLKLLFGNCEPSWSTIAALSENLLGVRRREKETTEATIIVEARAIDSAASCLFENRGFFLVAASFVLLIEWILHSGDLEKKVVEVYFFLRFARLTIAPNAASNVK